MIYRFGDCELDDRRYELRRGGVPCHLEPQVLEVLAYLVRHRDRVVPRTELLDEIWGSRFVTDSALASRVKAARRAVGDNGREQAVIRTVHGRGYQFLAPVQEQAPPPEAGAGPAADTGAARPAGPVAAAAAGTGAAPPVDTGAAAAAGMRAGGAVPVGREVELQRLEGLYGLAEQGRPQVVFVTGEPGIGKSTLVEAFAGEVERRAGRVARGQCLEQRGAPEPYLPVFDALGRVCRDDREALALLSHLAPTWLVQLPALVEPGDRADLEHRALGGTTERMLREAAEVLEAVASDRPLVLVLEDLHWADPSTLDLLAWLARRGRPARLLVVGTYRPADALAGGAPIGDLGAELRLRGLATELRLGELGAEAVAAVLGRGLPGADVPEELARLVHRRTDGVPLFVVQLLQAWTDTGTLRPAGGRWELAPGPDGDGQQVPDDLRRLLELQLERLDAGDLAMLETAAVSGVEFAAATAASAGAGTAWTAATAGAGTASTAGAAGAVEAVEARCAALARSGRFLRAAGPVAWPDGTVSAGFRFAHDLHRTVLYDRIPAGRRARLHVAVADRLERGYGPAAGTHAAELAGHLVAGHDHARAVPYLQAAAMQALGRSAPREAIQHLEALLDALPHLPDGPERDEAELLAQMTLGPALVATRGFASPEVEAAYTRAHELSVVLDRPHELALVLHGLAAVAEFRARYHRSEALLTRILELGISELALEAHELLACSTFHQGAAGRALGYAERGLAIYDEAADHTYLAPYGEHPAVACHDWAALALWFLGRPDSALDHAEQARALATAHPYSLASAEVQLAYLYQYRGEAGSTLRWAEQALATASEHGFPIRAAQAAILGGWALAVSGAGRAGTEQLRAGRAGYLATGAELDHPYYLALLAEALATTSGPAEGLAVVEEAIRMVGTERPFYYLPELHRIRGDLLAQDGRAGQAAEAYARAVELAASHGARSAELRAALHRCRLQDRSPPAAERARLRHLYDQFEEGFGTPDLLAARALLDDG
jgi:DNA-binding winged helix-turn-helix (wHTH) protein/tetratricopeptide (TPR) repeat protein/energy-coupling factor transporter ATP-binding protein EcfA2